MSQLVSSKLLNYNDDLRIHWQYSQLFTVTGNSTTSRTVCSETVHVLWSWVTGYGSGQTSHENRNDLVDHEQKCTLLFIIIIIIIYLFFFVTLGSKDPKG